MADELIEFVEDDEDTELKLEVVEPSFEQGDFTSKTVYDFIFDFYDNTVGKKSFYNVVNNNFNNIKQAIENIKLESSAITFNSDIIIGDEVEGDYNIGSLNRPWNNTYMNNLFLGGVKFDTDKIATKAITGEGFIFNDTIRFGRLAPNNYKEVLDLSNLTADQYIDDSINNNITYFKEDAELKIHVVKGGKVTLNVYASSATSYTFTVNEEESEILTASSTSKVAKYDQDIIITSKSAYAGYINMEVVNMIQSTITDKVSAIEGNLSQYATKELTGNGVSTSSLAVTFGWEGNYKKVLAGNFSGITDISATQSKLDTTSSYLIVPIKKDGNAVVVANATSVFHYRIPGKETNVAGSFTTPNATGKGELYITYGTGASESPVLISMTVGLPDINLTNKLLNVESRLNDITLESSAITFNSDMTLKAGLEEQYNIGSSASAWKNIYATALYLKSKKALSTGTTSTGDALKINANVDFNTIDIIGGDKTNTSKLQLTSGGGLRFTYGDTRFFNLSGTGSLQINGQQGGVFAIDSKGRLTLSNDIYTYLDFSSSTTDGGPRIEINDSNLNITDTSGHSDMHFSTGSRMSFETQSDDIDIDSGNDVNILADADVYTHANTIHVWSDNQFRSIAGTDYKFYPYTTSFTDNSEAILIGSEEYDDKRVKRKYLFATRKDLPDADDHTGNIPFGVEWETGDIYFRGKKFDPDNVATKMITGEGFIINGETITFGSAGNYKEKLDLSNLIEGGPTGYSDNGTTNTQFKQDSVLKIHVQEGGYVTLVGYSGYSTYTITVNGEESGELTGTRTSQIAKYDQDILITSKSSSNYYISITVYNMVETTLTDKIKELDDKMDHIKLESSSITFNSSLIPNAANFDLGVATNDATNKKYRWNNIYSNTLYTNHIQRVSGEELTISGDTDFEDQVTVEGILNTSDIIPTAHETSSIGTSALNYNKIYLQSIYLSNKKALSASITDTSNTLKINGSKHFDSVDICVSTDDPSSSITPKLQISKYGALTLKNAVNDTTFRVKSDGAIIANRKHSGTHDTLLINPSGDDDTYFHMDGGSIYIREDNSGGHIDISSQGSMNIETGSNDMNIHSGDSFYLGSNNAMTIDVGWNLDLLSYESMAFFTKKKMALSAAKGIKLYPDASVIDSGVAALLSGTEEYDDKKVERKYLFATRQALPDDTHKGNIPFGVEWDTGDIYIRGNKFDPQNIEAETLKATKEIDLGDSHILIESDSSSNQVIKADFKLPTTFSSDNKISIISETDLVLGSRNYFDIGTNEGPGISCNALGSVKRLTFYNYVDDEVDPVSIEWKTDKTNTLYVDNIVPITNNAFSLGTSSNGFKKIYITGESKFGGTMNAGDIKIAPNKSIRQGYNDGSGGISYVHYVTEKDLEHLDILNITVSGESHFNDRVTVDATMECEDINAQSVTCYGTSRASQGMFDSYIKVKDITIDKDQSQDEESIMQISSQTSLRLNTNGNLYVGDNVVTHVITGVSISGDSINISLEEV